MPVPVPVPLPVPEKSKQNVGEYGFPPARDRDSW